MRQDLALRLGTSRHPVREALGRLSGEGLVDFRPRYGYTVRALGPDEIAEIFEIRMLSPATWRPSDTTQRQS